MSDALKLKGLQLWCKKQLEGYPGVEIRNMTSSWKDGLAFCALIHRFQPDIIDFHSLLKENVLENNALAFRIAEKEMGIHALLDAEDMVAMAVPDRLCVITYVSQFYNVLQKQVPEGGPDVKRFKSGAKRPAASAGTTHSAQPETKKPCEENKMLPSSSPRAQRSLGDKCHKCGLKVYMLERHMSGYKLYHRSCVREIRRSKQEASDIKSSIRYKNGGNKSSSPSTQKSVPVRPPVPNILSADIKNNKTVDSNSQLVNKSIVEKKPATTVPTSDSLGTSPASYSHSRVFETTVTSKSKIPPQRPAALQTRGVLAKRSGEPDGCENPVPHGNNERVKSVLSRWPPACTGNAESDKIIGKAEPTVRISQWRTGSGINASKTQPMETDDGAKNDNDKIKLGNKYRSVNLESDNLEQGKYGSNDPTPSPRARRQFSNFMDANTGVADSPSITPVYGVVDIKNKRQNRVNKSIDNDSENISQINEVKIVRDGLLQNLAAIRKTSTCKTFSDDNCDSNLNNSTSPAKMNDEKDFITPKKHVEMNDGASVKERRPLKFYKSPNVERNEAEGAVSLDDKSKLGTVGLTVDKDVECADFNERDLKKEIGSVINSMGDSLETSHHSEECAKSSHTKLLPAPSYPDLLNPFSGTDDSKDYEQINDTSVSIPATRVLERTDVNLSTDEKGAAHTSQVKSLNPFFDGSDSDLEFGDDVTFEFSPPKSSTGRFDKNNDSFHNSKDDNRTSITPVSGSNSKKLQPFIPVSNSDNITKAADISSSRVQHNLTPNSEHKRHAPPPPKNRQLPKLPDPGPRPEKPPRSIFYVDKSPSQNEEKTSKLKKFVSKNPPQPSSSSPEVVDNRKKVIPSQKFNFDSSLDSSLVASTDKENEENLYSEVAGKSKRPAPPRPLPPKRQISNKDMTKEQINDELDEIDCKQTKLESKGRILEVAIREAELTESSNEEGLLIQWFQLVNEKNLLIRRETELVHIAKQRELEAEHNEIEHELRQLMNKQEAQKSKTDKDREEELLKKLLDLVDRRNNIVDTMDEDRLRHEEEDKIIAAMMARKFEGESPQKNAKKNKKLVKRVKRKEKKKTKGLHSTQNLICSSARNNSL